MSHDPELFVNLRSGSLVPDNATIGALIGMYPEGALFKLEHRQKKGRSVEQNNLYWKRLSEVIKATGLYPTPRHLHEELLLETGRYQLQVSLSGEVRKVPDKTRFNKMPHDEFCRYFDEAMEALARHGINIDQIMESA